MENSDRIDFIMVSYKNREYVELALESLERFTAHPFDVTLVDNGTDFEYLEELYGDKENYKILRGPQNGVWKIPGDGSKNHSAALTLALKNTSNPIVCFLDCDILFLDEWVDKVLPLVKDNFLVSNRFDRGICREMLMMFEREKFENYNLYPDVSHVDSCGNITKVASEHRETCIILENTAFTSDGTYYNDKSKHLLKLPYGEQCSIYNKPFFFHYGRGETRSDEDYQKFVKEARRYLDDTIV